MAMESQFCFCRYHSQTVQYQKLQALAVPLAAEDASGSGNASGGSSVALTAAGLRKNMLAFSNEICRTKALTIVHTWFAGPGWRWW